MLLDVSFFKASIETRDEHNAQLKTSSNTLLLREKASVDVVLLLGQDYLSNRADGVEIMNFGNLLHWAVVFLVVAIIAALLGFGGVAGTAMEGARLLFWVALILLVISLAFGLVRRG